ncbi:ABC transporter substrate-binding protein [Pseudoalteromonas sp. S16_S37]|uniref:ABC transporter substrate-binding protein n=1 Tax=Pseudoalteromonas sp. S16_S37 TaxID=2720228 RepID=UPI001EED83FC|nr:ABC transporter substrate-binding protein [Pseudoalteromonas sp. S16_S37]
MCTYASADDSTRVLKIYHDSDYSNHKASADAMKMGFMAALGEINNEVQGYKLVLVEKDHRGNSNRSFLTMRQFLADPDAIAILGGLHSPPYIKYRNFINENGILLLVPWAAGGPITRYPDGENWVYRLSIDDTKAGFKLVEHARQALQCKSMHVLLENTAWGKSNHKTISATIGDDSQIEVTWFNWNTQQSSARIIIRDIINSGADCIIFVGNAVEGSHFVNAMASFPESSRLPIVSHWGITGGNFLASTKDALQQGVKLHFIQSCFSLRDYKQLPQARKAVESAKAVFPKLSEKIEVLPAPTGFIHSYDLGRLFVAAISKIAISGDIKQNRSALRHTLENIKTPISGLIKTYRSPFSPWSEKHDDAHEALGLEDFCMAQYADDGGVTLLSELKAGAQ